MFYVVHGGKCCGIKTIHSLGTDPNYVFMAVDVFERAKNAGAALAFSPGAHKCPAEEPAETATQKLDRYLGYNDRLYPSGVVEVVLADSRHNIFNQKDWIPVLLARGFVPVTENPNSNSLNVITIYHRRLVKGVLIDMPEAARPKA